GRLHDPVKLALDHSPYIGRRECHSRRRHRRPPRSTTATPKPSAMLVASVSALSRDPNAQPCDRQRTSQAASSRSMRTSKGPLAGKLIICADVYMILISLSWAGLARQRGPAFSLPGADLCFVLL